MHGIHCYSNIHRIRVYGSFQILWRREWQQYIQLKVAGKLSSSKWLWRSSELQKLIAKKKNHLNMEDSLFTFDPVKERKNALLAIPKKGRLYERCMKLLEGAGLDHHRPNRLDVAHCTGLPVTIVFLPASDIASCTCSEKIPWLDWIKVLPIVVMSNNFLDKFYHPFQTLAREMLTSV